MARVAIVTACLGGFDPPHPQVGQDMPVDWFYVTDGTVPAEGIAPWRVVGHPATDNPRLDAKTAKMAPWTVAPGYDYYIWIDASMAVTSPAFAREAIEDLGDAPVAAFHHPRRASIFTELEASVGSESQGKYDVGALARQVNAYLKDGYRDDLGLYACGTLVWDFNNPNAHYVSPRWLRECRIHSVQDQLSFPYACWCAGTAPAVFRHLQMGPSGWSMENPWMRNSPHARRG